MLRTREDVEVATCAHGAGGVSCGLVAILEDKFWCNPTEGLGVREVE